MDIIKQPNQLVLAHNQVPMIIDVDDVITPGTKAIASLLVNDTGIVGQELVFEFGERKVVLVVKDANSAALDPLGSIPVKGSNDTLHYRNIIWLILKNHPVLSSFFEITFSGQILLTARNTGEEWNIVSRAAGIDPDGNVDANYHWRALGQNTTGTDDTIVNTTVEMELLVEGIMASGNFSPIVSLPGVADKLSQIKWDLSGNIRALFNTQFLPELQGNDVRVIYDITRRFRIFFSGIGSITGQPNYYTAINTGVKKEDFAKFSDFESEVLKDGFLSWRTSERMVTREQPEWLYFLQNVDRYENWNGSFDALELNVKVYFDNDTDLIFKPQKDVICQKYGVLEFPTGFEALNLADLETSDTITHYECWVVHNKDEENQDPIIFEDVTQKMTYTLVDEDYLDTYLVYRNSFNVLETTRVVSIKTKKLDTVKKKIRKVLQDGYETSDGELEFYSSMYSESFDLTLTASNARDHDALKEVLLSTDSFIKIGDHLVKVLVKQGSFNDGGDDNFEYLIPISLSFANFNSKFSAL